MTSRTTAGFWSCFDRRPGAVQRLAEAKYQLWMRDPSHPSLHFKPLRRDVWSVRINLQYRAMGLRKDDELIWFWIGAHAEYDRLVSGK